MAKDLLKIVSEESLKHFGGKVDELIKGRNLTRGEASDLFRQILNDEQPDLQQGRSWLPSPPRGRQLRRSPASGRRYMRWTH